jgi:hypothetical protein
MLLHWGAEYLERLLPPHLQARIKEPRCNPHLDAGAKIPPVPFVNALTGNVMAEIPIEGMSVNRISRMKLRRFLTEGEDLDIRVRRVQFCQCMR